MNENYLIPLLISGSVLTTLFAFYITIFVVINKNKHRRYQMEKREMEYRYEKELLSTKLEVQEQALNQVSQEIHDNIGQTLGIAEVNLLTVCESIDSYEKLIEDSKQLISKAITDLRNVSHVLNSKYINSIGLEESLKKELYYLSSFNKLTYEIDVTGEPDALSNEKELIIFRIAQEALSNIVKHANANFIKILVEYGQATFSMFISDNGTGFKPEQLSPLKKGIGIINMQQRALIMNGKLDISSNEGSGTNINLSIPL